MRTCRGCGGLCDPGDLVGGICTDCIEEERLKEERREMTRQLLRRNLAEQPDGQLVMVYGK